jgi:ankyrin repeat protein
MFRKIKFLLFCFVFVLAAACAPAQAAVSPTDPPAADVAPTDVPQPTEVPVTSLPASQEELDKALLDAISAEKIADVQALLGAGADPNHEVNGLVVSFFRVASVGNLEIMELLLATGGDLKEATADDFGVLRVFTLEGELTAGQLEVAEFMLTELLAGSWDIDSYDAAGGTLLFWAAAGNRPEIVQLLIDLGADPDKITLDNASPLMYASFTGKIDAVQVLIENGAQINYQGMFDHTALHVAAEGNHSEIVQLLIEADAELNLLSSRGLTPLGWALEKDSKEAAQVLWDAGAYTNEERQFELVAAVKSKDMDEIERLLDEGANPNAGVNGIVPLFVAVGRNNYDSFNLLMAHGGNVALVSNNGKTLLDISVKTDDLQITEYLLDALIPMGLDVNERNGHGWPRTLWAIGHFEYEYAELLFERGGDVHLINETYPKMETGLMHYAHFAHAEGTRILLEHAVDVNYQGKLGLTALHVAAEASSSRQFESMLDIILMLLEAGADNTLKNDAGQTPYDVAIEHGNHDTAQLLEAGYDPQSPIYILRKFESALNAADLDTLMSLCAEGTDIEILCEAYVRDQVTVEISNILVTDSQVTLEIKWFADNQYQSTQVFEATFEDGKITTLLFVEEVEKASG